MSKIITTTRAYANNENEIANAQILLLKGEQSSGLIRVFVSAQSEAVTITYEDKNTGNTFPLARINFVPKEKDGFDLRCNFCDKIIPDGNFVRGGIGTEIVFKDTEIDEAINPEEEVVETCPWCDAENTYHNWRPSQGYVVQCAECGNFLTLCNMCAYYHDCGKCDDHVEGDERVCKMGRFKNPLKKYTVKVTTTQELVIDALSEESAEEIAKRTSSKGETVQTTYEVVAKET